MGRCRSTGATGLRRGDAAGPVADRQGTVGRTGPRLWIVTRGAHQVTDAPEAIDVAGAPLWGLGRTVAAEHAAIWGGLVDLDPAADAGAAAASLAGEILGSSEEDQIAFRGRARHVARLVGHAGASVGTRAFGWKPDAAYLVTGGFGGIALEAARMMARQGARRLILMGRSGVLPRAQWSDVDPGSAAGKRIAAIVELEALGATVEAVSVDVGDEAALVAWLDAWRREQRPPIRGVLHAAGTTQYRALADQTDRDLDEVWHGKVNGAWLLHRLFAGTPLDCFVLFSSAASVLKSPMLGGYAAANAFLDALADLRRGLGLPVLSINWANWSGVGMAAASKSRQPAGRHEFVAPDEGVRILSGLLRTETARVAVMPMAWAEWRERYPAFARTPFLNRVVDRPAGAKPARVESKRAAILAASGDDQRRMLTGIVVDVVASVVRLPGSSLELDAPLRNLGMDSLMALEIRNQLQDRAGVTVPLVTIVDGPSLAELVGTMLASLSAPAGQVSAPDLDELSDDSVDEMLRRMLAER